MNICCKRLAAFQKKMQWSEEYAELDEAVMVLAKEDREDLTQQKKATESAAQESESFKTCYQEKFKEVIGEVAKEKKKQALAVAGPRKRLPKWPPHNISLQEAR
eukprot:9024763-Lingulodinium_polyedra.AAC.1